MSHVMLDLETWGLRPGCAIRSIGAVVFNPHADIIGSRFYRNVDLDSCLHMGLKQEQGTIDWWNKPENEKARAAFTDSPVFPMWQAIGAFDTWFKRQLGKQLWCQGPNFDDPVLTYVYDLMELEPPWKFYNVRCTRTIYEHCGFDARELPREGTYHNAVDDAEYQALCVQAAYRKRNGK